MPLLHVKLLYITGVKLVQAYLISVDNFKIRWINLEKN